MAIRLRGRWWFYPLVVGGALVGLIVLWLAASLVLYSPEYVRRVLVWGESDQSDYLNNFPLRSLEAATDPFHFVDATDEARVKAVFEPAFGVTNLDEFLADNQTQAFIVIKDDTVLYEKYFNGADRDSMLTSFSTAKPFDSALIGVAIDEGIIGSVTDSITDYLPETAVRDSRFSDITIRDLLNTASGLAYQEMRWALFNGDDPLTTYYTDQREIALENTVIVDASGAYFLYNKYQPQLLGLILEGSTGTSVTEYAQTRLWNPLGMEFSGAWALDSESSGFEKMEAGLNARAIDQESSVVFFSKKAYGTATSLCLPTGCENPCRSIYRITRATATPTSGVRRSTPAGSGTTTSCGTEDCAMGNHPISQQRVTTASSYTSHPQTT
jgi:CubicO group peptidase (beta-lactamase class C family)